ncbi:MAG: maleylacetoacetate isomerase [Deltaproteobacteria bacterium]|nr:maleylacetoacetate isomerase [Deltaproteobacteria bacterium]
MKLYNYWRSSASWRVRLALALKNLPYEYVAVNLITGEQNSEAQRKRNPSGAVPVLELDDGTLLTQSVAIVEYLEETHAQGKLWPADPLGRARVRMLVEQVNSGIQPYQIPACANFVRDTYKGDEKLFVRHFIANGLDALEKLAAPHAGKYLYGDTVTFADCCLVPQLLGARRFEVPLGAYPTLTRVEAALNALPAFIAAAPANQPDAPKAP